MSGPAPDIRIVDYTSPNQMEEALRGAKCVIHLVGIIKEMPGARYAEAHEQTCHALALAADRAGIERMVKRLSPATHATICDWAEAASGIKGFGHVKARNIAATRAQMAEIAARL